MPAAAPQPAPPSAPPPGYPLTVPEPGSPTTGPISPTPVPSTPSDDESRDSGLGLEWVWIRANLGATYVGLESINSSNLQIQNSASGGPAFGFAAGVRLLSFTVGIAARDLQLSEFNLWEVNGEVAIHMRKDRLDPYFGVRGGYAFAGTLSANAVDTPTGGSAGVSVHGYNAGLMFGGDYYFNHFVSLGIDLNPEALFLQRPKAALPANFSLLPPSVQTAVKANPLYQASGSSVGFGFVGTAHVGVHF